MTNRRKFIKSSALASAAILVGTAKSKSSTASNKKVFSGSPEPIVLSTWKHGLNANKKAWDIIANNGSSLDAVEKGVMVTEADYTNLSVGLGGLPDREGIVTLDASIMDNNGNCGAVAFLQNIKHPISVARAVMEKTPHVLLAGEGAKKFALQNGFKEVKEKVNPEAEKQYKEWLKESKYQPVINIENHDTIGMIAMDAQGNLSGACTTSGLAYKLHGRVGDSPIIGAGLYVDNEIGAACATGVGETVIKTCGSFLVVEYMRMGLTPTEACKNTIERLCKIVKNIKNVQVGFLAINKKGEYGAFSIHSGFNYAVANKSGNVLIDADFRTR